LRVDRRAVMRAIRALEAHAAALARDPAGVPAGELSLVFLTDPDLARLHADFLGDPAPTDVITFAGDLRHGTAGEICVSVDAAVRCARARRTDFSRELTLYLVHGWLHLAGHDDREPAKKRAMRRAEARALRLLERADAFPVFRLHPPRR
jgi:probable rRNA maturation factor